VYSKRIKSALQILHHIAIRIFVCAPPRCKLSQNFGAGGDGFPARPEKQYYAVQHPELSACRIFAAGPTLIFKICHF